jgi:hypothetical protein
VHTHGWLRHGSTEQLSPGDWILPTKPASHLQDEILAGVGSFSSVVE